jgi:hypothetical protein
MSQKYETEKWIHAFLSQPEPHGNIGLRDGLKLQKRYWIGPVEVDFNKLIQGCGPDPSFPFFENEKNWQITIRKFIKKLKKGELPPPLITEFRSDLLYIADGNHRFAALKENGYKSYWCFIWFNSKDEFNKYKANLPYAPQVL